MEDSQTLLLAIEKCCVEQRRCQSLFFDPDISDSERKGVRLGMSDWLLEEAHLIGLVAKPR